MSGSGNEFEQLMERMRKGDPEVGKELFERYGKAIQLVVRYRMSQRMRSQFDSLDFAHDAWASFFRIPADNYTFQTPEELVGFLTRLVRHKVIDAYRKRSKYAKAKKRKFRYSRSYVDVQPTNQPTASQVAIGEEAWSRLLANKPPRIQRALEMLREGYSRQEIAEHLELHVKTIHRLIKRLNNATRSP